jgi:hypothetical protein
MYYKNYKNPSVPAAAVAAVGPWGMTKDDFGLNWRQHRQQQKNMGSMSCAGASCNATKNLRFLF